MFELSKKSSINKVAYEHIKSDIDTLEEYYKNAKTLKLKRQIRDKLLFFKLKEIALTTTNKDIKKVHSLIIEDDLNIIKKALIYLNSVNIFNSIDSLIDMYIYRAYLYEILDIQIGASNEYKEALKLKNSKEIFNTYKAFIERSRDLNNFKKPSKNSNSSQIQTNIDSTDRPKSAKSLELIAKFLNNSKSNKNKKLAILYYKESLNIYKELFSESKEYELDYVLSLIKGVETFNMKVTLLDEAMRVLNNSNASTHTKNYLINKIKSLQKR